jgi:hypothetical protein
MTTILNYNGVTMYNVVTRRWDEECSYDQSGTDLIAQKFTITVEGIVHNANMTRAWVNLAGGSQNYPSGADLMVKIRRLLEQPRGYLEITTGAGKSLLKCVPSVYSNLSNPDRDVDNGPKPKNVSIVKIIKDTYRVSFTIECCKIECTGGRTIAHVINNRWSVSETLDDNKFMERTIQGRVRLSHSLISPLLYRNFAVPNLEDGFKRERVEFVVAANGLECDYTITDRQVHYAPPWPATNFECTYTMETGDGFVIFNDIHVTVDGHPAADKRDLFTIAYWIADSKLKLYGRNIATDYILQGAALVEHIGPTNRIEFRCRIQEQPTTTVSDKAENMKLWLTNLKKERIGTPLDLSALNVVDDEGRVVSRYDPVKNWLPWAHGYIPHGSIRQPAVAFVLQCFLQSPCVEAHHIGSFPEAQPTPSAGEGDQTREPLPPSGTEINGQQLEELPAPEPDQYAEPKSPGIITHARSETNWTSDKPRAHLPLARIYDKQTPPGDEETSVVVELGPSLNKQIVTYDAEKLGGWPEIPKPVDEWTDGSLKGKLLNHWVRGFPAQIQPDGHQKLFRLTAYYEYGLNRAPQESEKLHMGRLPHLKVVDEDEAVTPVAMYGDKDSPYVLRVFSSSGTDTSDT